MVPAGVIRPTLFPAHSVNHTLPSGPRVMACGLQSAVGTANSTTRQDGGDVAQPPIPPAATVPPVPAVPATAAPPLPFVSPGSACIGSVQPLIAISTTTLLQQRCVRSSIAGARMPFTRYSSLSIVIGKLSCVHHMTSRTRSRCGVHAPKERIPVSRRQTRAPGWPNGAALGGLDRVAWPSAASGRPAYSRLVALPCDGYRARAAQSRAIARSSPCRDFPSWMTTLLA